MQQVVVGSAWSAVILNVVHACSLSAAYIDPNTGGMLFQVLAIVFTFLSGTMLFFSAKIRMAFAKLLRRFRDAVRR